MKSPDRQVIASVSVGIAWYSLILLAAAFAFFPYALYDYLTDSEPGLYKRHYTIAMTVILLAGFPLLLRYVRHLLSGNRHMVWLEAGEVIFMHRDVFSVRCDDISDIKPDFDDRGYAVAVFTLKDGSQKSFPIQVLDRSHYEIVARLRTACGMTEDPNAWKPQQGW
jgi:hypothetical protein